MCNLALFGILWETQTPLAMITTTPPTVDDIVFENRNQAYGAYMLRKLYEPTLTRAAGIGVGLFLLAVSAPTLYARLIDRNPQKEIMVEANLEKMNLEPLPEKEKQIEIPPVEKSPSVSTVRSLPPEVLPDDDVEAPALPPTVDELAEANPGEKTQEGTGNDGEVITPPEETAAPTKIETIIEVPPRDEAPFLTVEQDPEFPGGLAALGAFVQKNLKYPQQAIRSSMSGRVYMSFVVNTDGSQTDIQVLKGIGFGCDEEAIRVIRAMPRWKPGKQGGRAVRVRFNLPVAFTLE